MKIRNFVIAAIIILVAVATTLYFFRPDGRVRNEVGAVHETALDAIDEADWVTVINAAPVVSGNNSFKNGDKCVIHYSGLFSDDGIQLPNGLVVVRYKNSDRHSGFGTSCGDNVLFAVTGGTMIDIFSQSERVHRQRFESDQLVESLRHTAGTPLVHTKFAWVTVANLDGVSNGNGEFYKGDLCAFDDDAGPYSVLGVRGYDGARLVRYEGKDGFGSLCGHETLFWIDKKSSKPVD